MSVDTNVTSLKIDNLNAEIARLKEGNSILSDLLYKMEAKCNRQEPIITELAEAVRALRGHLAFRELLERAEEGK